MLTTEVISTFPCSNCAHIGICKYENEVKSFCRSNPLPSLECLVTTYNCKYHSPIYSAISLGECSSTVSKVYNTGTPYTPDVITKCQFLNLIFL